MALFVVTALTEEPLQMIVTERSERIRMVSDRYASAFGQFMGKKRIKPKERLIPE